MANCYILSNNRKQNSLPVWGMLVYISLNMRFNHRSVYIFYPDAVPPIHSESYHVSTDKVPSIDGGKFRSIFSDNLQPIATRGKKACGTQYWSINTAATAVPLSTHPSLLVITTKLATAILEVPLFGEGALPAQYYPCGFNCTPQNMHSAVLTSPVWWNFPMIVVHPWTLQSMNLA